MLHDELEKLNKYPFHMPGHKRNKNYNIIGSEIDITEIDDFDNLHSPNGLIKDIEDRLSFLYESEHSFMLVNGSTVGILASIFSLTKKNDKIIIARNCHKSVYNACFLQELNVVYAEPEFDNVNGYYLAISQKTVDKITAANPDAKAIVITSPTYEGNISNINSNIPLIIDCAHGAHLGFGNFPAYPKADIVISSLHKTLPALTQTAVINVYNKKFTDKIKLYLDMLETSSPSYVLMNSVSRCIEFLEHSETDFDKYTKLLDNFYKTGLSNLEFVIGDDKGKIVVSTAKTNINGNTLAKKLREKYNIECEMASMNYIILMTSVCDTDNAFKRLSDALTAIDSTLQRKCAKTVPKIKIPCTACKASEIRNQRKTALENAENLISAEYVYAYPPDIPIIAKGEIISKDFINSVKNMIANSINIISDSNLLPDYILTKAD